MSPDVLSVPDAANDAAPNDPSGVNSHAIVSHGKVCIQRVAAAVMAAACTEELTYLGHAGEALARDVLRARNYQTS